MTYTLAAKRRGEDKKMPQVTRRDITGIFNTIRGVAKETAQAAKNAFPKRFKNIPMEDIEEDHYLYRANLWMKLHGRSKYTPHQGTQECARRVRQERRKG